jgi:hypothetical protein
MDDLYIDIYKLGTYYNPSQNHYGKDVEVSCDRCLKRDLVACIGWGDHDLCLTCASFVDEMFYEGEIIESDSE